MAWGHFIEKVTWTSVLKKVRQKAMEQPGKRFSGSGSPGTNVLRHMQEREGAGMAEAGEGSEQQ